LSLNASVKVLEAPSVGGVMRVEVGSEGEDHVIGEAIAEDIFVSHMG
jgi:hypothetical protein